MTYEQKKYSSFYCFVCVLRCSLGYYRISLFLSAEYLCSSYGGMGEGIHIISIYMREGKHHKRQVVEAHLIQPPPPPTTPQKKPKSSHKKLQKDKITTTPPPLFLTRHVSV